MRDPDNRPADRQHVGGREQRPKSVIGLARKGVIGQQQERRREEHQVIDGLVG